MRTEIVEANPPTGRTKSDMGSGYFPSRGWTWAAYMINLKVQTDRNGTMANYDGTSGVYNKIEPHFGGTTSWGSYCYVGGPGAG
jgi:hypothetical protein